MLPFAIYLIALQLSLRSFKESPTTSFYEKLGTYSTGQEGQRNKLMIVLCLAWPCPLQPAAKVKECWWGWLVVGFLTAPTDTRQTCICYQKIKEMCVHISILEVWKWISFQALCTCDRTSVCCCPPKVGGTAAGSWRLPENPIYNQIQNFLGERSLDHGI